MSKVAVVVDVEKGVRGFPSLSEAVSLSGDQLTELLTPIALRRIVEKAQQKKWVESLVGFAGKLKTKPWKQHVGLWEATLPVQGKPRTVEEVIEMRKQASMRVANNILEFLINPRDIPVRKRLYVGPEENLQNEYYESAEAAVKRLFGDQRKNSDFYPSRGNQPQREASLMDRRTMVASMDILSQAFTEDDPIATDLRTMALAVSEMSDDQFATRLAKAPMMKCKKCGSNVLKATKYCLKCKAKLDDEGNPAKGSKKAGQNSAHPQTDMGGAAPVAEGAEGLEQCDKEASAIGLWNKKAAEAVVRGLVAEVAPKTVPAPEGDQPEEKKPVLEAAAAPVVTGDPAPASPETKPVPEAKKPDAQGTPVPAQPASPSPTASVVDTSILVASVDGVEMEGGLVTADDVTLSDSEKAQLDSLFA